MNKNIYEQKSLLKLILAFGIPSILSLMIEMLTGIVDTIFAGNLPGIGDNALSAMALISPVLGIFTALQTLFAMSTGILIAKYLTIKKEKNNYYKTGVIMSFVISMITSIICYLFLPNILNLLGASNQVFYLAKIYLQIQLISNIFSSLGYTLTSCIRAFGFPKVEVIMISTAVFINIIFNFLFSFVFNMGIFGLGLGTLVSEVICFLLSVIFLIKKNLWIKKEKISIITFIKNSWELFKIGISQTFIQILGGCTGFIINFRLLQLGTISYVAAWSIIQRIYTFLLMPIVGITQGVQNIIAYFKGKEEKEKIKTVSKYTILICTLYGILAFILVVFFGYNLVSIFGGNSIIIAEANSILLIVFLGFPLIGILYTVMTLLQVTNHEVASVLLILSRQVFFLIPLIYIIPFLVNYYNINILPVISLFICMPIADFLAILFAIKVKKMTSLP
ncbi:MAG: MATE family efflux transporter [Clostridia bacterium]